MLRAALAALTAPLALAALTGCGAQAAAEEKAPAPAVPAGVQKQYEVLAEELAEKGKTVESGEWTVNLITEAAEPWFEHGTHFRAPKAGETHHIEIIPTETSTGRIVPDVPITLEVVNAKGKVVQEQKLNFYYSTFYHYANNFTVPEDGTYTLRATLGSPGFNRHGEETETPALAEGATVEFKDVELTKE
ncbi:iron transporter [Sinomonas halotolerans]|uniref:Iron transporter n=1 Tax=Sinomonas halotolerans TaxID=1644133 RepID=A0ABU9WYL6_9MICC